MQIADYAPRVIYPDVVDLKVEHYEQGLDTFISRCARDLPEDTEFYSFGKVTTPGVSDIDLLIIVRDEEWQKAHNVIKTQRLSSGLLYYLFFHEPLIVPRSIVPHICNLHTLGNCRHVYGKADALAEFRLLADDDNQTGFTRHAVWASFIRIAALQLQHSYIGLRKALMLMHNLLSSALQGNEFLSEPVAIDLSTDQLRGEILKAPFAKQDRVTRYYLGRIVESLNQVDTRIDQEFKTSFAFDTSMLFDVPISRERSLVPLHRAIAEPDKVVRAVARKRKVLVPVPDYQLVVAARLARDINQEISGLELFRKNRAMQVLPVAEECLPRSLEYTLHLTAVVMKCPDLREYPFISPFGLKLKRRARLDVLRQCRWAHWFRTLPDDDLSRLKKLFSAVSRCSLQGR
jgi:hypothetical protein